MACDMSDRDHRIGDETLQRMINKCDQRLRRTTYNATDYGDFGINLLEWHALLRELQQLRKKAAQTLDVRVTINDGGPVRIAPGVNPYEVRAAVKSGLDAALRDTAVRGLP